MKNILLFICSLALALSCSCPQKNEPRHEVSIIPMPQSITYQDSHFSLNKETVIYFEPNDEALKSIANFLNDYIQLATGFQLETKEFSGQTSGIILKADLTADNKEAYHLQIDKQKVLLQGASSQGTFWGIQSLRQIIPANHKGGTAIKLPGVSIEDSPRFQYRGMHLDVGRHMYDVAFIKKYIDILAMHKINTFHWHLTEDQGWRLEIKKYPKLTEVGAFRSETVLGHMSSNAFDGKPYGGFYTQEEAKEIVKYAAERFITVIPEIELPGHTVAVLAAFPHLGCTGGPYEVRKTFGVAEDVFCAGNEAVFEFLQNVFDEVLEVFPSTYIHIGGDECPKVRWEKCRKCQARIKKEKLKDEHELQSYFIQRIERYLNDKGRKIIGWDEILEGGLAPNATIMSWRGVKGGIEAARQNHDVIMTPNSHAYFDHYYTSSREAEDLCIGGYLPVEKVYSFDPVPAELEASYHKHILGGQANVWTEYLKTSARVEFQLLPRLAALSEAIWSPVDKKDWSDFKLRLFQLFNYYDAQGFNYAKFILDPTIEMMPAQEGKGAVIKLQSSIPTMELFYTLDGSTPTKQSTKYEEAFTLNTNTTIKFIAYGSKDQSRVITAQVLINKATQKKVSSLTEAAPAYAKLVGTVLSDGMRGSTAHGDGQWVGYHGTDAILVVDLEKVQSIRELTIGTLTNLPTWILGPSAIKVEVSEDGKTYQEAGSIKVAPTASDAKAGTTDHTVKLPAETKAQYVKVTVSNPKILPTWHQGAGKKAFIFVDEIQIN